MYIYIYIYTLVHFGINGAKHVFTSSCLHIYSANLEL